MEGDVDIVDFFKGPFEFLSNFASSPFTTSLLKPIKVPKTLKILKPDLKDWDGVCPTVEHAYQALKTLSEEQRYIVLTSVSAGSAKKLGRKVTCRPDWDEIKILIMEQLVLEKFEQNPELADKLLATGDAKLIEGNWWGDTFWGICRGVGQNHLGKILMKVRERIRGTRK